MLFNITYCLFLQVSELSVNHEILINLCNYNQLTIIIVIILLSLIAIATTSISIGTIIGLVIGVFCLLITVVVVASNLCCLFLLCKSCKHRTSNTQLIELRSATMRSYPLAENPLPSYPKEPPPSYLQQFPASNPLPSPADNTVYPDQDTNMEEETLRRPPPPSYANLYND